MKCQPLREEDSAVAGERRLCASGCVRCREKSSASPSGPPRCGASKTNLADRPHVGQALSRRSGAWDDSRVPGSLRQTNQARVWAPGVRRMEKRPVEKPERDRLAVAARQRGGSLRRTLERLLGARATLPWWRRETSEPGLAWSALAGRAGPVCEQHECRPRRRPWRVGGDGQTLRSRRPVGRPAHGSPPLRGVASTATETGARSRSLRIPQDQRGREIAGPRSRPCGRTRPPRAAPPR